MGSGAYSVFIDQQAGGGPAGALQRVVPLPPPELSGGVKFTTVVLSLAYDNFGAASAPATTPATVRILRGSGSVQTLNVNIEVGRKFFHFMHADDQAASVQLNPPAGFRPQVSAMVDYAFPKSFRSEAVLIARGRSAHHWAALSPATPQRRDPSPGSGVPSP